MSFSPSDLLLPDQMTVRGAGEAVAGTLSIKDGTQGEHLRNYYDTFDGLLHAAGLTLVHEDGRLSLIERATGLVRDSLATPPPRMPLFAAELEPGPLRDSLRELTDIRALLPLVQIHSRERRMSVLDAEQKTVVRLALEETSLAGQAGIGLGAATATADHPGPRLRQGAPQRPGHARAAARIQAGRRAARGRGGQGRGRSSGRLSGQGRRSPSVASSGRTPPPRRSCARCSR